MLPVSNFIRHRTKPLFVSVYHVFNSLLDIWQTVYHCYFYLHICAKQRVWLCQGRSLEGPTLDTDQLSGILSGNAPHFQTSCCFAFCFRLVFVPLNKEDLTQKIIPFFLLEDINGCMLIVTLWMSHILEDMRKHQRSCVNQYCMRGCNFNVLCEAQKTPSLL